MRQTHLTGNWLDDADSQALELIEMIGAVREAIQYVKRYKKQPKQNGDAFSLALSEATQDVEAMAKNLHGIANGDLYNGIFKVK
jgi:hypothetical protein